MSKESQFSPFLTSRVLDEVLRERERQDSKWGQQNHSVPEYLMILGEEVGEANKEGLETYFRLKGPHPEGLVLDANYGNYRSELVQIAAVAVAMIECLDRNGK